MRPMSQTGQTRKSALVTAMSASLIGRLGSSTFRLSTTAVSMSLTGSRFVATADHLAAMIIRAARLAAFLGHIGRYLRRAAAGRTFSSPAGAYFGVTCDNARLVELGRKVNGNELNHSHREDDDGPRE